MTMKAEIRRTLLHIEDVLVEGGKAAERPQKLIAAVAVLANPWFGRGFIDDLGPAIREISPLVGRRLAGMVVDAAGSGDAIEGFGKCAVVGMGGEAEHAAAIIHYVPFGNQFRQAVGAKSFLAFNNMRGAVGAPIMIPLMDKHDAGRRSHYQSIHLTIPDAPADDELVVALGASIGGRLHHRIGDRYSDMRDLGLDPDNPAGV
jgi:hypothetical protein